MPDYSKTLNEQKALIWRIVHINNLPWILANGLHAGNSAIRSPNWTNIGNPALISRRVTHPVPIAPQGCLNDYVPFYFTPFSPMMYNIKTGRGGVQKYTNGDIVILVSSLHKIQQQNLPFVFTDRHACLVGANFYSDLTHLNKIDWQPIQARDFKRDQNNPQKMDRYQAEALIYQHCPISALIGIVCYSDAIKNHIDQQLQSAGLNIEVIARRGWYF